MTRACGACSASGGRQRAWSLQWMPWSLAPRRRPPVGRGPAGAARPPVGPTRPIGQAPGAARPLGRGPRRHWAARRCLTWPAVPLTRISVPHVGCLGCLAWSTVPLSRPTLTRLSGPLLVWPRLFGVKGRSNFADFALKLLPGNPPRGAPSFSFDQPPLSRLSLPSHTSTCTHAHAPAGPHARTHAPLPRHTA